MCGIAGIFNLDSSYPISQDRLRLAVSRMALRGPDDRGFYQEDSIALGHRRLSIIDAEGGHQPFVDKNSGGVLVYNGEIYNFKELREELQTLGHTFLTRSDTEVLLKACIQWGTECLTRLNGMFAFAFFDTKKKTLLLARDRVGIKPLFYGSCGGQFIFASSMPAVFCLYDGKLTMDHAALAHYLTTIRTTLGRRTLVQGIHSLLPGEYLFLEQSNTAISPKRYWDIPAICPADKKTISFNEASETIKQLMQDSVSKRLISDVPLGGFLSGGLDSTILASIASQQTQGHYNAYSVGYDIDGYNEWSFVNQAIERYGMWCRDIHLKPENYSTDWKFLIQQKGQPLSTPNEVPIYHLAKALRHDFTVALSGEGADEIFGGYTLPYFSAYDYDRAERQAPAATTLFTQALQRLYGQTFLPDHVTHHFLLNSWMPMQTRNALLTTTPPGATDEVFAHYLDMYTGLSNCSTFDQHMHIHARVNLEGLLSRVDSSTMAASVEARVPFTDHRIIDYLFQLPDAFKINWISTEAHRKAENMNVLEIDQAGLIHSKRLLRDAFRNEVPGSILSRKKMSFPVPVNTWIQAGLRDYIRDEITSSDLYGTLFSKQALDVLLNAENPATAAHTLWPILNLITWQREFRIGY